MPKVKLRDDTDLIAFYARVRKAHEKGEEIEDPTTLIVNSYISAQGLADVQAAQTAAARKLKNSSYKG